MKGNSKVIPDNQRAAGRCNAVEGNLKLAPERIGGTCEPCVRMRTLLRLTPVIGFQADISRPVFLGDQGISTRVVPRKADNRPAVSYRRRRAFIFQERKEREQ